MSGRVLGVDPGSRETGLVVRDGKRVVAHEVVVRAGREPLPGADYLNRVVDRVAELRSSRDMLVAVEGLNEPNPHMGVISVRGLLGTAMVLAVVLLVFPDAVQVPPGGNGSSWIKAYPVELRPTGGSGKGHDRLRHCRSSWDISVIGERLARVGAR